ncbi:MAG: phosphopantetheine-binding protein [Caldilineaceae bacterium]
MSPPAATPAAANAAAPVAPPAPADATPAASALAGGDRQALTETLRAIVVDRTGYPPEMIGDTLDLEAELGVDSIKRIEILETLKGLLPQALVAVMQEHFEALVGANSLAQIVDALVAKGAGVADGAEAVDAAVPAKVAPDAGRAARTHAPRPPGAFVAGDVIHRLRRKRPGRPERAGQRRTHERHTRGRRARGRPVHRRRAAGLPALRRAQPHAGSTAQPGRHAHRSLSHHRGCHGRRAPRGRGTAPARCGGDRHRARAVGLLRSGGDGGAPSAAAERSRARHRAPRPVDHAPHAGYPGRLEADHPAGVQEPLPTAPPLRTGPGHTCGRRPASGGGGLVHGGVFRPGRRGGAGAAVRGQQRGPAEIPAHGMAPSPRARRGLGRLCGRTRERGAHRRRAAGRRQHCGGGLPHGHARRAGDRGGAAAGATRRSPLPRACVGLGGVGDGRGARHHGRDCAPAGAARHDGPRSGAHAARRARG